MPTITTSTNKIGAEMKIYKLYDYEYWYDRSYRTWYAIKLDQEGNQVGEAIFAFTKEQIILYIEMEQK